MESSLLILILLILLAASILAAISLYKLYKVHLLNFAIKEKVDRTSGIDLQNLLKQIQCLDTLHLRLGLERGELPPAAGWTALPDLLLELEKLARAESVEKVVECGSGLSTIVFAKVFSQKGRGLVYSLESDKQCAEDTREHLERLGLSSWAKVIDAPLESQNFSNGKCSWYSSSSIGEIEDDKIDLLFVDGPPVNTSELARYPALEVFSEKLKTEKEQSSWLILDDGIREQEQKIAKKWAEELPALRSKRVFTERKALFFKY